MFRSLVTHIQANAEYCRGNYVKAIKLLASSRNKVDATSENSLRLNSWYDCIYLNNLGCIDFKLQKLDSALSYFRRALDISLQHYQHHVPTNFVTMNVLLAHHSEEVLYNMGITLLFLEKPTEALSCFQQISQLFVNRPYIWIRMAECCLLENYQHHEHTRKLRLSTKNGTNSIQHIVSIVNEPALVSTNDNGDCKPTDHIILRSIHCLQRALHILTKGIKHIENEIDVNKMPSIHQTDACDARLTSIGGEDDDIDDEDEDDFDGNQINERMISLNNLRLVILLRLSYSYLCIKDWIVALNIAKEVIQHADTESPVV